MSVDVEKLYEQYGPMVLRRCRRMLRNEEEAVDAMHDTFVHVLRRRDQLEVRTPSALLHTIATNTCLDRLRARKRKPEDADDDLLTRIAAAPEVEERAWARIALDRVFAREVVSTRVIATLVLVDGMTWEEVAADVGMSVSGVRKRISTLRAHVAELEGAV